MTALCETKRYTDEVYRRALKNNPKAVLNHIRYNNYDSAVIFLSYEAGDEFDQVDLKGEHYFITIISTYGHDWDGNYNTKYQETYEVSKEEGNKLYLEIKRTKKISIG